MCAAFKVAKRPSYIGHESKFVPLRKGYDIKLNGDVEGTHVEDKSISTFSISPKDFTLMSPIPKVVVAVGDHVKAGDPLFFDKKRPEIIYASPVSGEVVEIRRAEKRSISDVIIKADSEIFYKQFTPPSLDGSRQDIVDFLLSSGGWSLLNQRPFDIVPDVDAVPRDIFVSTFSTAPLAVDGGMVLAGNEKAFNKGIEVLSKLTEGKVHLGIDAAKKPSDALLNNDAVKSYFTGKHPAGNVGVQIHHTAPIGTTDKVWTLDMNGVITLGKLFAEGKYDTSRIVKLAGSQFDTPKYIRTFQGASINELVSGNIKSGNNRIIAGDVLTGKQVTEEGFLGFKNTLLTSIKEGDFYAPLGWLLPKMIPSISRVFPSTFIKGLKFDGNTNTYGEKRAFVVTGQYEKVLPMDIYVQHLMKAILANDFESMEGLGINELSEEDVALCEFVCTSKQPIQSILRKGLDLMREQS